MIIKINWSKFCWIILGFLPCYFAHADFLQKPGRCPHEDSDCISNAITFLFNQRPTGDESLNFPGIDPYRFPNINLTRTSNILNIECTLIKNDLIGYRNIRVHKVKGFGSDISKRHEIYYTFLTASLIGDYQINGTILSYPIYGVGKHTNTMINAEVAVFFTGKPYTKNGYTHMKVDDMKIAVEAERYIFNFTNLFNNDAKRTQKMNDFLNKNWYIIYQDLHPLYFLAFENVFSDITNMVFEKFPYETLFIESQY